MRAVAAARILEVVRRSGRPTSPMIRQPRSRSQAENRAFVKKSDTPCRNPQQTRQRPERSPIPRGVMLSKAASSAHSTTPDAFFQCRKSCVYRGLGVIRGKESILLLRMRAHARAAFGIGPRALGPSPRAMGLVFKNMFSFFSGFDFPHDAKTRCHAAGQCDSEAREKSPKRGGEPPGHGFPPPFGPEKPPPPRPAAPPHRRPAPA